MIRYNAVGSGTGGGIESVTGFPVDVTDPLNPIVKFGFNMYYMGILQSGTSAPTTLYFKQLYTAGPIATPAWSYLGTGTYLLTFSANVFGGSSQYAQFIFNGFNNLKMSGIVASTTTAAISTYTDASRTTNADDVLYYTAMLILMPNAYIL